MSMSIDGLASGLKTADMIDKLMKLEAAPQKLLKDRVTSSKSFIEAMQALNKKVAELATFAGSFAKPAGSNVHAASSNSNSVTATAGAGAAAGSIEFTVDRLAQSQVMLTGPLTEWPDQSPTLTFVAADGTKKEVTAASSSLADVAAAINKAGVGVNATLVKAGVDPDTGKQLHRLQLSTTKTGASAAFTAYRGTIADVEAGTAANLESDAGTTRVREAQDAQITLWSGTDGAQAITSSTNTFKDVLPGVTVNVTAASTTPVTVTVARDGKGIAEGADKLVTSLNEILAEIAKNQRVTTSTDSSGENTTKAGVFAGDSTVRDANQKLIDAVMAPIDNVSPSTYGISITRDGKLTFDKDKFAAALAADPDKVTAAVATVAQRVADAATGLSDKYDGTLTAKIKGEEKTVESLKGRIVDWDTRLADRRESLEKTYARLEVWLQRLQAQSVWLANQLASLASKSS